MSQIKIKIDEKRQQILDCDEHLLILGGPGSGKTTISLAKAKYFIESKLAAGQRVLFLSFSNSAIRQLGERSQEFFEEEILKKVEIQTYHSFCWNVLKSYSSFLYDKGPVKLIPPHEEAVLSNSTIDGSDWGKQRRVLFKAEGRLCFDLFAEKTAELFSKSKSLTSKFSKSYPLIIVDEFQDSDDWQWELIKLFSKESQVICSADPDQRIYEWREDVSPERLKHAEDFLKPIIVDFKGENNRSPDKTIAVFGNQVLDGVKKTWDDYVSLQYFYAKRKNSFEKMLNATLAVTAKQALTNGASKPLTIAILGRTNKSVKQICKSLDSKGRSYTVFIDEKPVIQAGRVIANFLQTSVGEEQVIIDLKFVSNFFYSKPSQTHHAKGAKLNEWAELISNGKKKKTNCISALLQIREGLKDYDFSGDPIKDWIAIRDLLEDSGANELKLVAEESKHLKLLKRGTQIVNNFSDLWKNNQVYDNAVSSFESAISQEQIIQNQIEPAGTLVMTMHKCKGKEFDATIVVDHPFMGQFIAGDNHPFIESRRLLHVAVTRSRFATTILMDPQSPSPLI